MLGIFGIEEHSRSEEATLTHEKESLEEVMNKPSVQLKPSEQPEMKEVLTHILGSSASKKYSITDK
jgi:hypothetical protein